MISTKFFTSSFFLTICLTFLIFNATAQENSRDRIGISLAGEFQGESFNLNTGFIGYRNFTPKSGLELGVLFRTELDGFTFDFDEPNGGTYSEYISIREGFLNFPILYRFTTKFATFSIGPNVDAFTSWDQIGGNRVTVNSYDIDPSVQIGALFKISRVIPLKGTVAIEPEFRMGRRSLMEGEDIYFGFGVRVHQAIKLRK